jgi:hypothetical protein
MIILTQPLYTTKCIHIIEVIEMENNKKTQKQTTLPDDEYLARKEAVEQYEAEKEVMEAKLFGCKEPYFDEQYEGVF